jgi:hypothetical protein
MKRKQRPEETATYAEYAEAGLGSDYLSGRENGRGTIPQLRENTRKIGDRLTEENGGNEAGKAEKGQPRMDANIFSRSRGFF